MGVSVAFPEGTIGYQKYPDGFKTYETIEGECTKDRPWEEEKKF